MNKKWILDILAELNARGGDFRYEIIFCDAKLQGIVKRSNMASEIKFGCGGGTDLQPAFDLANGNRYKSIICFTDGFLNKEILCKKPTTWVIINNNSFTASSGEVVNIEMKE